ncbi:uncharacterized protein PG998_012689 [Apiospora kogelbergensis]|uniref:uncharacterized protein n=1 Tax=Apiospora kogelbergensis TaxID=1337665 RepID=UPI00312D5574
MLPEAPEGPPGSTVEFGYGNGAVTGSSDDDGIFKVPDPVGVTPVIPTLGPGVSLVELDIVKGGTTVGRMVPGAVFPVPVGPGDAMLEFAAGNGGRGLLETGTVCPAGLLSGALISVAEDAVKLDPDGAVICPELPVGPALEAVMLERGKGGCDSEDVISDVSGAEKPVFSGAVPDMPPVGAAV